MTKRILIVDDTPTILKCLKFMLTKNDYNVHACDNTTDAFRMAVKFKPHIILSDYIMPGENGLEFCNRIRETEEIKDCIFLIMTNKPISQRTKDKFHDLPDGWISKLIGFNKMINQINKWMELTIDSFDY